MSGLLGEVGTPCPAGSRSSRFGQRTSDSTYDSLLGSDMDSFDDTQDIEFTTEIKAPILTGAKPRRRNKTASSFHIHDEEISTRPPVERTRESGIAIAPSGRKSSLLAQPAQRFRPKVSFDPSPPLRPRPQNPAPRARRSEMDTENNKALLMRINGEGQEGKKDVLKKDVRRDTVYIPPDDTTVATAFMGMFSPLKSQAPGTTEISTTDDTQVNSLEAQIVKKQQAKRPLTSSARRAPLQPSTKIAQEASIPVDNAGKNGGKENIPPGGLAGKGKDRKEFSIFEEPVKVRRTTGNASNPLKTANSRMGPRPATNVGPTARRNNAPLQKTSVLGVKENNAKTSRGDVDRKVDGPRKQKPALENKPGPKNLVLSNPLENSKTNVIPDVPAPKSKLVEKHPLLTENITRPAMYEDDWLSHQEVVITQLINGLFEYTDGTVGSDDSATLRYELLELYQDDFFSHLYKRLQPSLLHGAMSIPKDVLARNTRLKQDLGLKRRFLNIWTQTYDLNALRAAVETVTGRRVTNDSTFSSENDRSLKKKLETFLDAFLLQNEDMKHVELECSDKDVASRAYRRTVLRSIMIVVLLDRGRSSAGTLLPRRLFHASSPLKSSVGVLQSLARMLLPSSDIIKSLNHLDCPLFHEQGQLQEYEYPIKNLAVDLRDGVKLTRIVELLLFPSASCPDNADEKASMNGHWPLSEKLKLPCTSRAAKVFNVKIALSLLASTKGAEMLVNDIHAEDIVDGHREKTIALLWGLVSKWGLVGLVDWNDLKQEIERLKRKAVSEFGYQVQHRNWYQGRLGQDEQTGLLQQWASILAGLKGLQVDNLCTSFADGKVYESIVDEYQGYLLGDVHDGNKSTSLKSRLQSLGCSSQFANLVSPGRSTSNILDKDFTIGALAFLCSRLLSASKRVRAATVLQIAWRRVLLQRVDQRRAIARDVARQCAAVIQTRDQILWAKGVIVMWWRKARRERVKADGIFD